MELNEIYFDTGELRLHAYEGPRNGPPMVLLHGATGNAMEWGSVLPHLTQSWHVYAVHLRGHGKSGRPADISGYHMRNNAADTAAFLRGQVREPAVVIGHSYGAVTAALTAKEAGDMIRALVLEDPPMLLRRKTEDDTGFKGYFEWLAEMRAAAGSLEEVTAQLAANDPNMTPERLRQYAESVFMLDANFPRALTVGDRRETVKDIDFAAHIRAIQCPTLLMQADEHRGAALVQADIDFFLEHAPHTRLVTFPGSGHGIHTEQPEAFLKALDAFLADVL